MVRAYTESGVGANLRPLQKAQVLTQRRKAAKILKKTFDLLCALASWRLDLIVLLFKNYVNREDSVGRYSYRLWLRNKFRVTFFQ
jgi:lipopolysaccharide/colanic/teichoic acid biosynthesis glycosyltransferase